MIQFEKHGAKSVLMGWNAIHLFAVVKDPVPDYFTLRRNRITVKIIDASKAWHSWLEIVGCFVCKNH